MLPRGTTSTGHRAVMVTRRDTPPSSTARPGPYPREPMTSRSRFGETLASAVAGSSTNTSLSARTPGVSSAMASATVASSAARLRSAASLAGPAEASAPIPGLTTVRTRRSASAIRAMVAAARSARRPSGVGTNATPIDDRRCGGLWPLGTTTTGHAQPLITRWAVVPGAIWPIRPRLVEPTTTNSACSWSITLCSPPATPAGVEASTTRVRTSMARSRARSLRTRASSSSSRSSRAHAAGVMPARTDATTSGTFGEPGGGHREADGRAVQGLGVVSSENGHGSTMAWATPRAHGDRPAFRASKPLISGGTRVPARVRSGGYAGRGCAMRVPYGDLSRCLRPLRGKRLAACSTASTDGKTRAAATTRMQRPPARGTLPLRRPAPARSLDAHVSLGAGARDAIARCDPPGRASSQHRRAVTTSLFDAAERRHAGGQL